MSNSGYTLERQLTEITLDETTYLLPAFELRSYISLLERAKLHGARLATFAETVKLINFAFQNKEKEKEFSDIAVLTNQRDTSSIFTNTAVHYFDNNEIYVEDNPTSILKQYPGGIIFAEPEGDKDQLEKRLDAGDPNVRFLKLRSRFSYDVTFKPTAFAEDPLIIAMAGSEEIAKQVTEIALNYKSKKYHELYDNTGTSHNSAQFAKICGTSSRDGLGCLQVTAWSSFVNGPAFSVIDTPKKDTSGGDNHSSWSDPSWKK